jgi:hypothetical protein
MYNKYFDVDFPNIQPKLINESFSRKLLESAASNELFALIDRIETLDTELRQMGTKKNNAWDKRFSTQLDNEDRKRLSELEAQLRDLQRSYTFRHYNGQLDDWDDDTYDEKRKAEVAEEEAALRAEIEKLRDAYTALYNKVSAEHKAEFTSHDEIAATKDAERAAAKKAKPEALAKLLAEEKPALDKIMAQITASLESGFTATLPIEKATFDSTTGKLTIPIYGKPFEVELTEDDYDGDGYDADDYSFDVEAFLDKYERDFDDYEKLGGLDPYTIADSLNLDPEQNHLDYFPIDDTGWFMLYDISFDTNDQPGVLSVDYDPGSYSGAWEDSYSSSFEMEYDTELTVIPICYLVKEFHRE